MLLIFGLHWLSYCLPMSAGSGKTKGSSGLRTNDDQGIGKKWSWSALRHDLAVGLISGAIVSALSGAAAVYFDDQRSEREGRVEDLRFVRERSSNERIPRPFRGLDLKEQNLSGLSLIGANLENAMLEKGQFFGTNLESSQLHAARIHQGVFGGTILKDSILTHADLSNSEISETDLSGSNLDFTNLSGATLSGVELLNTSLSSTRLDGADMRDMTLDGVDTSRVCYDKTTKWPLLYEPPVMDLDTCRNVWPGLYR